MSRVSVAHVVASLHPRFGGPARTVVQLADALAARRDIAVTIVTQSKPNGTVMQSDNEEVGRHVPECSSSLFLKLGLPVRTALNRLIRTQAHGIIHSHGIWLPVNSWAAQAARRHRVPLIIHPRGMLEPWALNYKRARKRVAMILYQRRDIEAARVLIATSLEECRNIRELGFRVPIAIIPNGILEPATEFRSLLSTRHEVRKVLFLSRIHPIKGLLNLVSAWAKLRPQGWRLQIAGPDEGGHLKEVMAAVYDAGMGSSVEYIGEVTGPTKMATYRDADLFVLPTFSESFGVAVAEALSHGLPVITTRGAPWGDLLTHKCGWWIDVGVDPLVQAMQQAMALTDDERRQMGERGRSLVRQYNWSEIARQTADVYRWLLGDAPLPDCVRTE